MHVNTTHDAVACVCYLAKVVKALNLCEVLYLNKFCKYIIVNKHMQIGACTIQGPVHKHYEVVPVQNRVNTIMVARYWVVS